MSASSGGSQQSQLKASVIVLGWNGRAFLDGCLSSVLDQDLPPDQYEVLYVDNGSTDGSLEFVRDRFPRVRTLSLDRNYGYAEGNNRGLRETSGEYVVLLNQDTVVHRGWLAAMLQGLRSSPGAVAGHANIIQPWYPEYSGMAARSLSPVGYSSEASALGYIRYHKLPSIERTYDTIFTHGVCIIIRRSVVDELGYLFDPDLFAYAEDLDLGLRLRALGYRSVAIPAATVYHKHQLQTGLSWYTIVKTVRIIRNRHLAFFKVMSGWEFALMVPLLTIGAPFNALEFGLRPVKKVLFGLALLPAALFAVPSALVQLPRYASKRRDIRGRTPPPSSWCLRALWRPSS
jgi:GT2 family glycosyltransferase